jgi:RNA polymerase sigma factor (sigma-70 family)
MDDDCHLLRAWVENRDEDAFRALVDRHLKLVYSAARRLVADENLAEDVAHATFIVLARKAPSLVRNKALPVWLYRTTRYAAVQAIRAEARRADRHRSFADMQITETNSFWEQVAPLLESAMARLRAKDREALVLRFMGEMTNQQVGTALGISEEAARKRIDRALEKLRAVFSGRGVHASSEVIAAALSGNLLYAAPVGLATKVAAVTLASTAATSITTSAIAKGTIQFMAWTKVKIIGVSVAILLLGGVATVVVKKASAGAGLTGHSSPIGGELTGSGDPVAALRRQLAAAGGTPEQIDNLVCVDNLKKIGAALVGATAVPDDPLTLKDKLDTPLRFHCPKDTAKPAVGRWSDLRRSDISYVFGAAAESPGVPAIARCPIHGHVLLSDGRVIQGALMAR